MALKVPFPRRTSTHRAAAGAHNLTWLREYELLGGKDDTQRYVRWNVPDLTARSFPDASYEDLCLATDLFSFYFLFDDQFDGALGVRPREVARACEPLIAIAHGDYAAAKESPYTACFADVWRRSSERMSSRWRARAAYNWEWYFAAHPNEALGRSAARVPDRDSYLMLRRGTGGMETVLDMLECFADEVPAEAFHSPQLRLMRQLASDVPTFSNDVHSLDKEAPHGDVNNLVMVLQQQRQCGRDEACAAVLAEAQWMIDQYSRLATEIPELCTRLGLGSHQRRAVERYADGLASWLSGYLDWESLTERYHPIERTPEPPGGEGAGVGCAARDTRAPE